MFGSMTLTSLPIVTQQWGRKHNENMQKNATTHAHMTRFYNYVVIIQHIFIGDSVYFCTSLIHKNI